MKKNSVESTAPERYELADKVPYRFDLSRRDFFQLSGAGVVIWLAAGKVEAQESGRSGTAQRPDDGQIAAWLHISEDGAVTVFTGKVEVGQNARTSLSQAVAEELNLPLKSIEMVMGDTARTPYDRGTFGSLTTPQMAPQLRRMAAAAKGVLLTLAADRWDVNRDSLMVKEGRVWHDDRSLGFGELTQGQQLTQSVSQDRDLTAPDKWQVLGKSIPKVNGEAFVTGAHQFTSDMTLPEMLFGKIVRPPAFNATLQSADLKDARQIPGVTAVQDGNFIGVAAPTLERAEEAAEKVQTRWNRRTQPSDREIFSYLKAHPTETTGWRGNRSESKGNIQRALEQSDHRLKKSYRVAYIAHAPLEPRAALAKWEGGRLTVWTGTQRPFGVRSELSEAFRLPEDRVRVIVPDTGSGYGGKHTGEAAIEAARLAKAVGKPVKLVWTRQEEFTWAYFRPAGVIEIESAFNKSGRITRWEFHNYNSGDSAISTPYQIPNQKIEFHSSDSPLRQGSYRALAATANNFARETHMDEAAKVLDVDPLKFRLRNLKDPRLRAVLTAAARAFSWDARKTEPNVGCGLACGTEKGGYVATCAEVFVDPSSGEVKIRRLAAAFDCGAVVNPDHLKNQIEGALVQGMGGALFEAIQFEDGQIKNPLFSRYRVPRFSDLPEIKIVIVDRQDLPSAGAGEAPIIAVAPAIGNAIFEATGTRLRSLPLNKARSARAEVRS